MDPNPVMLTADEVGRLLRLGRSSIYRMAARGELPHVVITGRRRRAIIRFDPEVISRWIDEHRRPAGDAA